MADFKDVLWWTVDDYNAVHKSDLKWLNDQVSTMARDEPGHRIAIFTHHSPTVDLRRTDQKRIGNGVSTSFATGISREEFWANGTVVAWAFGHTHFNCAFTDTDEKAIISNQKGYWLIPAKQFDAERAFTIGERGQGV